MATVSELLDDARQAYHALMTGRSVAQVRDSNGETITYTPADKAKLAAYIADLERQAGTGGVKPIRIWL